jgi:DNA repair protein RecN (Recombination protein N)
MLSALTIRDIVLIDHLHLEFSSGLTVLTGETGAGKSIILDALGLALGARGDGGLVREGAREGTVIAAFAPAPDNAMSALLETQGMTADDGVILRRVQGADGRTRAFINDQPVSVQLLRQVGAACVELHGQHDDRALLDSAAHRALLDAYAGLENEVERLAALWQGWQASTGRLKDHLDGMAKARAEEEYLRFAVGELEQLSPEPGEEERLAEQRQMLMHAEKFSDDLNEAHDALIGDGVAETRLNAALRKLERNRDKAQGRFDAAIAALDRAMVEIGEARQAIATAQNQVEHDPQALERIEERLFALKAAARKHQVQVDALPALATDMADRLAALDTDENTAQALEKEVAQARSAFDKQAQGISEQRGAAAARLDDQVRAELPPLKLEKARFETRIETLEEAGPFGIDQVEFTFAANPGQTPGALMKVASGGELARVILGLKVVLAERGSAPVLVFDEVDTGAGGAVADAIGARLAALARNLQVISVTHSPQVAAQARDHWRILKRADAAAGAERALTEIERLDATGREEEVARMLAGAEITREARAAAARLIGERA